MCNKYYYCFSDYWESKENFGRTKHELPHLSNCVATHTGQNYPVRDAVVVAINYTQTALLIHLDVVLQKQHVQFSDLYLKLTCTRMSSTLNFPN